MDHKLPEFLDNVLDQHVAKSFLSFVMLFHVE